MKDDPFDLCASTSDIGDNRRDILAKEVVSRQERRHQLGAVGGTSIG